MILHIPKYGSIPRAVQKKDVLKVFRGQRTVTCIRAAIMMQRPQQGETLSLVMINHSWKKGVLPGQKYFRALKIGTFCLQPGL